jgi:uncharacterized damage-inducible protein DinB
MASSTDPLRAQLIRALAWDEAHVGFDKAVAGVAPAQRGARPAGFDHSIWQLVEHLRLAQEDLLRFAVDSKYVHDKKWPDDYWPRDPAPPSDAAWDKSLADFAADQEKVAALIADGSLDLFALVPTGTGLQTRLRAILLIVDHNAYHVGQIVSARRALGIWGG